ncbi:hypothetical protein [Carboxylicivirga sp. N1Y90]|uniref:hypothetical protein n=1 Tax=Carboxylicivirga fragile TaxID=3417571 RepID=UPI003D33944C|nr:hypothetical protein [Marinilabiliaceae bacterium N1Y90]
MNLFKKGIFAIFIIGLIASCETDKIIEPGDEDSTGSGLTEITFSSFTATPGPDENGVEDGTYVTVEPLAIGVDGYDVDFGNGASSIVSIEAGGSASYDYPNEVEVATYTIKVTAKSDVLENVSQSQDLTVEHEVAAVSSAPDSPTIGLEEVLAIYSDGIEHSGEFISYRYEAAGVDFTAGAAQQGEVTMESGNKVMQYSRLSEDVAASIALDQIIVADAFGSSVAATHLHLDVHSDFAKGIDKLRLVLVNGDTEYDYNLDLVDGEWINLNLDLATDFSGPVVQFDEIKFELGAEGMAEDAATLNVDNVFLHKPITSVILNGDFDAKTDHWRFTTFTDGTTTPFGSSSDGSWTNYDGSDNGSKTPAAKWTASQSGGYLQTSNSRYAYQALQLLPNTDYVLEYEYTMKSDDANDPIGGRSIVGLVLDAHYTDGAEAVANLASNLGNHVGTIAEGKFSDTVGTLVQLSFTTNDSGEVAVMFYAVTSVDSWIDNVKVYQD